MTDCKHYELYGTLFFVVLAVLPLVPPIFLGFRCVRAFRQGVGRKAVQRLILGCALAVAVYAAVVADAFLVEPNWPRLRTIEIEGRLSSELTILHISDLHIEKDMAPRDRWIIETVRQMSPDIIVITGDIHQIDNDDTASLDRVLRHMSAPLGVFATGGYDNLAMLKQVNTNIVYLQDDAAIVRHNSDTIVIAGSPRAQLQKEGRLLATASYGIILEHTPDRTVQAGAMSADLYLCGHTHGGQVRIPFWGAIMTNCETGKRFEAGLYSVGKMFVHTSRGLGLEPRPAPQVRFFCRPEATLIKIVPARKKVLR